MKKEKINCDIKATDVFKFLKTGQMYLGDYLMTDAEVKNLQEEIKSLEKTRIWEIWHSTIKSQAVEIGMYKSMNFEDMRTAKAYLKVLATLKDINNIIKSWKPKPVPIKIPDSPIEH